jgi:histidinol-phosphate aminotransferase
MIIAGNGSDEILAIAARTFLDARDLLAYPAPTYSLYPVLANIGEIRVAEVAWEVNWTLPIEALVASGARAIFFANPNAPSGTLVPVETVGKLARSFEGLVLVDEAYVDFADGNCLSLLRDCPNVIISRTLSKAYSLAGLRFGYAVAAPDLIAEMNKVKDSYNCDALSVVAATAAIEDQGYARRTWEHVRGERTRVSAALAARGWSVIPSQANFILAGCPADQNGDAGALYRALKARGILVRYFDLPGLSDKLRITVGTREENDALLAALPSPG